MKEKIPSNIYLWGTNTFGDKRDYPFVLKTEDNFNNCEKNPETLL